MVEPPSAYTVVTAFSNASRVRMSRLRRPARIIANVSATASRQSARFASVTRLSRPTAGRELVPGGPIPSASTAADIVFAVNMAEHVPVPGSAPL